MNTNHETKTAKRAVAIVCFTLLATPGILGCGGEGGGGSGMSSTTQQSSPDPFTSVASAESAPPVPAAVQPSHLEAVPADSLPPDVAVIEADTVAAPGAYVEIAARASSDVVEVFLWDGIGRKQSLEFDSSANLWHARYRVPLGISAGRIGVAVTAKNGAGLKHRVWTFLRIDRGTTVETPVTEPPAVEPEGEAEREGTAKPESGS